MSGKSKSGDIFGVCGALRQKLLERTSNSDKDVIINKVCDDAFKLWDGVFSAIHSPSPTVEHCMETQEQIDKAMAHIRSMGFSVKPKLHGMESYVVTQMRTIPGGIGKLMEHWIKQYHVGSLVLDKRAHNLRVQLNKMLNCKKGLLG